MANEAEIINNPDSTPGAVSTGYQLQNTNMVAERVGDDKTVVAGGTGECTLKLSGPVDVNGTLYTINSDVTFTLTTPGAYYIHLSGTGDNLTPTIGLTTTYPHTFDADKNARYTDTGSYRVLNWVIYYDGTTAYAHRIITPENTKTELGDLDTFEETWITSNGNWTAKRSKYYTIYVTGSGGDGGSVSNGTNQVGGGGGAGATVIKRIWIDAGDVWTATFSATENQFTVFTDGSNSISAENGNNGVSNSTGGALGGQGGNSGTLYDILIDGGSGGSGIVMSGSFGVSGTGGGSFYGSGGRSSAQTSGGSSSGAKGTACGSGGGGAITVGGLSGSAGSGEIGVIRIIG